MGAQVSAATCHGRGGTQLRDGSQHSRAVRARVVVVHAVHIKEVTTAVHLLQMLRAADACQASSSIM